MPGASAHQYHGLKGRDCYGATRGQDEFHWILQDEQVLTEGEVVGIGVCCKPREQPRSRPQGCIPARGQTRGSCVHRPQRDRHLLEDIGPTDVNVTSRYPCEGSVPDTVGI